MYLGLAAALAAWYNLSHTHSHVGAPFFRTRTIIQDNRPIYAVFKRTGGSHAVVIAGYRNVGERYYYKIMDPGNKKNRCINNTFPKFAIP